jgi:hypothetical protein
MSYLGLAHFGLDVVQNVLPHLKQALRGGGLDTKALHESLRPHLQQGKELIGDSASLSARLRKVHEDYVAPQCNTYSRYAETVGDVAEKVRHRAGRVPEGSFLSGHAKMAGGLAGHVSSLAGLVSKGLGYFGSGSDKVG